MNAFNPIVARYTEGAETFAIHLSGAISRPAIGMRPSGGWQFRGLATAHGRLVRTFAEVMAALVAGDPLPSHLSIADLDHGTFRVHGSPRWTGLRLEPGASHWAELAAIEVPGIRCAFVDRHGNRLTHRLYAAEDHAAPGWFVFGREEAGIYTGLIAQPDVPARHCATRNGRVSPGWRTKREAMAAIDRLEVALGRQPRGLRVMDAAGRVIARSRNLRGLLTHGQTHIATAADYSRGRLRVDFRDGTRAEIPFAEAGIAGAWVAARRTWGPLAFVTGDRAFVDAYRGARG